MLPELLIGGAVVIGVLTMLGLLVRHVVKNGPRLTEEELADAKRKKANFDRDSHTIPRG